MRAITSAKMAKLAAKVLGGYEPTRDEIESMAACVLRQREHEEKAKVEPVSVAPAPVPIETITVEVPALTDAETGGFWTSLFKKK